MMQQFIDFARREQARQDAFAQQEMMSRQPLPQQMSPQGQRVPLTATPQRQPVQQGPDLDAIRNAAIQQENVNTRSQLTQLGVQVPPLPEGISPDEEAFYLRQFLAEADPAIRARAQESFERMVPWANPNRPIMPQHLVENAPGWARPVVSGMREMTSPVMLGVAAATAGVGPAIAGPLRAIAPAGRGVGTLMRLAAGAVDPIVGGGFAPRMAAESALGVGAGAAGEYAGEALPEGTPPLVRTGVQLGAGLAGGMATLGAIKGAPAAIRGVRSAADDLFASGSQAQRGGGVLPGFGVPEVPPPAEGRGLERVVRPEVEHLPTDVDRLKAALAGIERQKTFSPNNPNLYVEQAQIEAMLASRGEIPLVQAEKTLEDAISFAADEWHPRIPFDFQDELVIAQEAIRTARGDLEAAARTVGRPPAAPRGVPPKTFGEELFGEGWKPRPRRSVPKEPWDMTHAEFDAEVARVKDFEAGQEVRAFGKEGAERYKRLQRTAGSTMKSPEETNRASQLAEEMEDALSPEQYNELMGIGDTGWSSDELSAFRPAFYEMSGLPRADLIDEVRRNFYKVNPRKLQEFLAGNPAALTDSEQVSAIITRNALRALNEQGVSTESAIRAAGRALGQQIEPADAEFLVREWRTAAQQQTARPRPALAAPEVPPQAGVGIEGLPRNPDGTVTLYHGTTREAAPQIARSRTLVGKEDGVFLTTDRAAAASSYGDGTVVEVRVRPERLIIDDQFPTGRRDYRIPARVGEAVPIEPAPPQAGVQPTAGRELGRGTYFTSDRALAQGYAEGRLPVVPESVSPRPRTGTEVVSEFSIPRGTKIFAVDDTLNPALRNELSRTNPRFREVWTAEFEQPTQRNIWDAAQEARVDLQGVLEGKGFKGASRRDDFAIWDPALIRPAGEGIQVFRGAPAAPPQAARQGAPPRVPPVEPPTVGGVRPEEPLGEVPRRQTAREFATELAGVEPLKPGEIATGLTPETDPIVLKATQAIKEAGKMSVKDMEVLAAGRSRQIARAGASARQAKNIQEIGPRFLGGARGAIERPGRAPIRGLFEEGEIDELLQYIWGPESRLRHGGQPVDWYNWDQSNAWQGFEKLFHPDSTVIPLPSEISLLERAYGKDFVKAIMNLRTRGQKNWDLVLDVWNLPRATLATADISATVRQAGVLAAGDPNVAKNLVRVQLKSFKSESFSNAMRERIRNDVDYGRITRNATGGTRVQLTETGVAIPRGSREERFYTSLAGKAPILKQSERAYVDGINYTRYVRSKTMIEALESTGVKATDVQLDAIGDFINYASGRGPLWKMERAAPILNGMFFSIRLTTSRLALPTTLLTRAPGVRKQIAKNIAAYVVLGATILEIADAAGADVGRNPTSSDFGKIRWGNMRLDIWAGFTPWVRLLSQTIMRQKKSASTGTITQLDTKGLAENTMRFLRSKAHPSLGLGIDVASEEDYLGEDFSLDPKNFITPDIRKNPVLRTFTPLIIQDIVEALKNDGIPQAAVAGAGALIGVGVISFVTADQTSKETYGVPYVQLWPYQKGYIQLLTRQASGRQASEFDKIDDQHYADFLAIAKSRDLTQSQKIDQYFSVNTYYAGKRRGTSDAIFGDGEIETFAGGTPEEQAALQEYYDTMTLMKPSPESAVFNTKLWSQTLSQLEQKWQKEGVLDYIRANTNTRMIPVDLLKILPASTRSRIKASSDARAKHEQSMGKVDVVEQAEEIRRNLAPTPEAAQPMPTPAPQLWMSPVGR